MVLGNLQGWKRGKGSHLVVGQGKIHPSYRAAMQMGQENLLLHIRLLPIRPHLSIAEEALWQLDVLRGGGLVILLDYNGRRISLLGNQRMGRLFAFSAASTLVYSS